MYKGLPTFFALSEALSVKKVPDKEAEGCPQLIQFL